MANWQINVSGKGIRKATVEKLAANLKAEFGEDAYIGVTDNTPPESRADRLQSALGAVSDARSEVESLKEELESWYDNLPESFQNGEKGEALQSAVSELDDCISNLESAEGCGAEFPGMY
jgi:hypothetical protein